MLTEVEPRDGGVINAILPIKGNPTENESTPAESLVPGLEQEQETYLALLSSHGFSHPPLFSEHRVISCVKKIKISKFLLLLVLAINALQPIQ